MKFDVTNRFTGAVQFTAEIDCADDASTLGLAVRWALESDANLSGAYLFGADLSGAYLIGAYLRGADLRDADLSGAYLSDADLRDANLRGANLSGANLIDVDLSDADLSGANLSGAYLIGAYLRGADLRGADLRGAHGVNEWVKCIQIDTYPVTYTAEIIQIGRQRHTHQDWAEFPDAQILAMDGAKALAWWKKYKAWLFQTIEICPAKPTGFVADGRKGRRDSAHGMRPLRHNTPAC